MCNEADLAFGRRFLDRSAVQGREVLEVGSFFGEGLSLRPHVESLRPRSYLGVDIRPGPGVDRLCRVEDLETELGRDRFDVVIATELVEHVRAWRAAVSNLKSVVRPGGLLIVTTRSAGYPYHGAPADYWRFEPGDMARIFAEMEILAIEPDPSMPGVFVAARRRSAAQPTDLAEIALHAVPTERRQLNLSTTEIVFHRLRSPRRAAAWLLPGPAKAAIRRFLAARR